MKLDFTIVDQGDGREQAGGVFGYGRICDRMSLWITRRP
jgi:hypothetical protein